ncbi:2-hydroxyacid dehydrogenase [Thalassotalea euphylliae]|uniref:2-hydroxyacid dehydrogenase n=1 Tax=Thalassotalea euphylliae TaxID=1655234 RepID=A0A3E0UA51_9GAMM|nr:2-hydroxyacid dehydrogenase [Thalassotalea euphylliae]REL33911.1 2-hydroxyacid dehydrogenase [Thalassotalea euphylliae]
MFRIAVFSSKKYDRTFFDKFNTTSDLTFEYFDCRLSEETVELAQGFNAVCVFVNDQVNANVLAKLASFGIETIALRCAGFNNVDIAQAKRLNIKVCRVPEYSPQAVAEHTVGLMLTLSRKFHKAYNRIREDNFALDGLMGFNLYGKTVGIIGTGNIGMATLRILKGFGCQLLCYDPSPSLDAKTEAKALTANYVPLATLFQQSDIISLHCPLVPETKHLVNAHTLSQMKPNAMLVNTSRGALVDTKAVIKALKSKQLGYLGIDVYEQETNLFFEDLSGEILQDDTFARLSSFPNVLITGHQGFFTEEAIATIAQTTIESLQKLLNQQAIEPSLLVDLG